jgi:hypothetical protein
MQANATDAEVGVGVARYVSGESACSYYSNSRNNLKLCNTVLFVAYRCCQCPLIAMQDTLGWACASVYLLSAQTRS